MYTMTSFWKPGGVPLAWRQLSSERKRFAVAVAGVMFGVILMLFQLGIYQAFMQMVVRPIDAMKGDLAMISADFQYIMATESFPERRLYQVLADPDVVAVYPVMIDFVSWRNPETGRQFEAAMFGVHRFAQPFTLPGVLAHEAIFSLADEALYDSLSAPEFGAIADWIQRSGGEFTTDVNKQRVRVRHTFEMGQTLAAYGHILVGAETFRRLNQRLAPVIELGMIELREGANPTAVAERLQSLLPEDVEVVTRAELKRREREYWQINTPIGFIVTAGLLIAIFVGAVIVYQILYTDINDHLKEYATLKALGMPDRFFLRLILQEATLLPLFGFLPGIGFSMILFYLADTQGGLPTRLTGSDTSLVMALTIAMCVVAGLLATRRLRAADPADIF